METKVPARRTQRLTHLAVVSLAVAIGIGASSFAHAGTLTGGATEWTQILNNIQLVESYVKQAETMKNTLQSAQYLQQSLKQLDPSTLSRLQGNSLSQVDAMVRMSADLDRVINSGNATADSLRRAMANGQASGMTPQEYLQSMSQLSAQRGDAYQKSYEADQQHIQDLQSSIKDVQATAAAAPEITSEVGGMQALLTQGTQTQTQLLMLNGAVTEANALTKQQMKQQWDQNAAEHDRQLRAVQEADDLKKMQITFPDPTKIPLAKDKP